MAKNVYNIYMTFPSDVKTDKNEKKDISVSTVEGFELQGEFGHIFTTSETAIKYLLKKKIEDEKELDFTLDRVFLLLSDTVAGKIGFKPEILTNRPEFDLETTHLDVLNYQMDNFYKNYFDKEITPLFSSITKEIPCGNSLDDTKQLGDSIIKLCEAIVEYKKDLPPDARIKLYIDTTGGFRNAAMLFLIIGRIMSYLGIEIEDIFYTGWSQKKCTVHEIKDTYDLLDLISGFEEFLMFGSAKKLNAHYKLNEEDKKNNSCTLNQKSIDELIKAMDRFSDVVNISRRGEFKTELSFLSQRLSNISFDDNSSSEDFNYQLIKFLREPIEREYKSLVDYQAETTKDDLSYVEWCLKHDYVQQALTLFKECVPSFLVNKGLIVIDEKKLSAYLKDESLKENKAILEAAFNKWKDTDSTLKDNTLVTFNAFYKEYTSVFQPEEDVRDDVDLAFNEINAHRSQLILKYSNREQLFKNLKQLLKDYVTDVQNTEFIITRDSKSIQERNENLETVLKSKQVDLLKHLFNEIRAFKLVPVKDDSSKAKKVISFLTAIAMNATNLKDVNNLPIKVRAMIYNGNVNKLKPYLANEEDFQFVFNDADHKELRLNFYKILKNQIKEDVLFGDITKGFILTEYDFEREAKDIYKTCDTSLYNIEGLAISEQFKDSLSQVIKILAYYFEIKKSRNDSNHARIEESSQFTTSSEIKYAMDECIKLIRELIK